MERFNDIFQMDTKYLQGPVKSPEFRWVEELTYTETVRLTYIPPPGNLHVCLGMSQD